MGEDDVVTDCTFNLSETDCDIIYSYQISSNQVIGVILFFHVNFFFNSVFICMVWEKMSRE